MNIFPFGLLAAALLLNRPGLAQMQPTPVQPAAPSASTTQAASSGLRSGMATAPSASRQITVANLTDRELEGQDGSDLGEIDRVVESTADKRTYIVVNSGGLFGFFGTEYLVPVDQVAITGDEVVATTMNKLEGATLFVDDTAAYRPLDGTKTVNIPVPH